MYNYYNIKKIGLLFKNDNGKKVKYDIPRKLVLHKNYVQTYTKDVGLLILGSGPGTFNSRTSFLLNGDYSKNSYLSTIFDVSTPAMAEKYVYPLWNSKITSQSLYKYGVYNDGTRNQPFSSIISLLSEYGLFTFVLLFILIYNKYELTLNKLDSAKFETENKKQIGIYRNYIKFISIFIVLNLFTDNFLEYPEIIAMYLIMFKLIELTIPKTSINLEYSANKSN
jgi:hypothetical protein